MSLHVRTVYRLSIVILLIYSAGCAMRNGVVHRMGVDETLLEISHAYGVELMEILSANQITDPALLKPGQKIWIPGGDPRKWAKEEEQLKQLTDAKEPDQVDDSKPARQKAKAPKQSKSETLKQVPAKKILRSNVASEFDWPAQGTIISPFGMRKNKMHNGVDIRLAPGTPVKAAADGQVVYYGHGVAGYGDLIIVKHKDRLFSVYAYLGEIKVAEKTQVRKGDVLAFASRNPTQAFIHFELRQAKRALDPQKWMGSSRPSY